MDISKIRLQQLGLKGLVVNYIKTESKDGFEFLNEHVSTYKRPVQGKLKDKILKLEVHVRNLCCLTEEATVEVRGFFYDGDKFTITAVVTNTGGKNFAVNTPLLKSEEEYEFFVACTEQMDEIYKEVAEYAESKEKINVKQFMMDFAGQDTKHSITPEEATAMTPKEALVKAREVMEKYGAVVIVNEEEYAEDTKEEEETPFGKEEKKKKMVAA